jgi:hypothetical protein
VYVCASSWSPRHSHLSQSKHPTERFHGIVIEAEETDLWVSNTNAVFSPGSSEHERKLLQPSKEINQAALPNEA